MLPVNPPADFQHLVLYTGQDAFGVLRLAGIAQGVYKRGLDGNASSPRALEMGNKVAVLSNTAWALVES